jgi:hypothetical protein
MTRITIYRRQHASLLKMTNMQSSLFELKKNGSERTYIFWPRWPTRRGDNEKHDLGYFDLEQKTLQPLDNPFGTRLSPIS